MLSDGKVFENQKYLKLNLKKLRVLQRTASRRYQPNKKPEQQSNNWKKVIKQIAKLQEHIAFQRHDYLHKTSTWIAKNYSTVCIESLDIKGMKESRYFSQSILDCGWGTFIFMLKYKCDNLIEVDRWFASSQICFECGYQEKKIKDLSNRDWICPICGTHHDRDLNAAKNIEREGLSLCGHKVENLISSLPQEPIRNS